MDIAKVEIEVLKETVAQAEIQQLDELELVLVGGGMGDVAF